MAASLSADFLYLDEPYISNTQNIFMNGALTAKILRPRFARAHRRSELLGLLDALNPARLIVVSGLVGAGKTALVSSYVESINVPCLWYQLDRGDENLDNFFNFMSMAAAAVQPRKKDGVPLASPECTAGVSIHVKAYFRDLYRFLESPFFVVFNNCQELRVDGPLREVLRDACDVLPANGRMIMINSNENPPMLAWLRTNCSVVMIGWQELRLDPNKFENEAALNARALPADEAAKRLRRMVGDWAAELLLDLQSSLNVASK